MRLTNQQVYKICKKLLFLPTVGVLVWVAIIIFTFAAMQEAIAGCGAVGSVLRSGRRGRKFESSHPDKNFRKTIVNQLITMVFLLVVENVVEKMNLIFRGLLPIIEYLNNLLQSYDCFLAKGNHGSLQYRDSSISFYRFFLHLVN
jgi:hypothetical protein